MFRDLLSKKGEADPDNCDKKCVRCILFRLTLKPFGITVENIELANKGSLRQVVAYSYLAKEQLLLKELPRLFFKVISVVKGDVAECTVNYDERD